MVPPHPHRMRLPDRCLGTCYYFCAVLLGMCFEKMRTNLVSLLDVWSNCSDAIASISSRWASNSAAKSRAAPLQRPAKSPSAALLIWHCTICSPFLIVNLNAIKSASYPMASPRVSGMNPVPFCPLKRTARWAASGGKWPTALMSTSSMIDAIAGTLQHLLAAVAVDSSFRAVIEQASQNRACRSNRRPAPKHADFECQSRRAKPTF